MPTSLKKLIWGERLAGQDPLFGRLTTRRLKGRPGDQPEALEWFADPIRVPGARFREIEQVVVHAGHAGPGEGHRRSWLELLERYPAFEAALEAKVFDNYLWHREMLLEEARTAYGDEDLSRFPSWPECANAEEAFARPCFDTWWLDVYDDGRLEFYLCNDWDEEHNLRVLVRDGRLVDLWQD